MRPSSQSRCGRNLRTTPSWAQCALRIICATPSSGRLKAVEPEVVSALDVTNVHIVANLDASWRMQRAITLMELDLADLHGKMRLVRDWPLEGLALCPTPPTPRRRACDDFGHIHVHVACLAKHG